MWVQEPGSKYVGHITPKCGKAVSITNSLKEHFKGNEWETIKALGSDGTAVNTGMFYYVCCIHYKSSAVL